jgi:hypothetical protein
MNPAGDDFQHPQRRRSDSTRSTCGCLIIGGVCIGFFVTVFILVTDLGLIWAYVSVGISTVVVTAAAMRLRNYHHQPDIAPDFLARLGGRSYAEADGFCFRVLPCVIAGRLEIHVFFQNRFDQPCRGRLNFRPNGFFRTGLVDFGFDVSCGAGAFGMVRIPWPLAAKFAGKKLTLAIESQIEHPQGRGNALRFRMGKEVRSTGTSLQLHVPAQFTEYSEVQSPTTQTLWNLGEPEPQGIPSLSATFNSTP